MVMVSSMMASSLEPMYISRSFTPASSRMISLIHAILAFLAIEVRALSPRPPRTATLRRRNARAFVARSFASSGRDAPCVNDSDDSIADTCAGDSTMCLVMFRLPSRHTYGFVRDSSYDLPMIELRSLVCAMEGCDAQDVQFAPVHERQRKRGGTKPTPMKAKAKKAKYPHGVQSLHWMTGDISPRVIAEAASRAILTHATFDIKERICFSETDWNGASNDCCGNAGIILDHMDVIDMTNPNISRDDRSKLIGSISCSIAKQIPKFQQRLQQISTNDIEIHRRGVKPCPIIIHDCIPLTQDEGDCQGCLHQVYFGYRTSIGPAGTRGAPSQTLRRTHRGLLKEYALKRRAGISNETGITSTAMEPEVGFLMANLALAGIKQGMRVLDPCCGSGSLLLYAGALGAKKLVGVDSDQNVWEGAECEFRRYTSAADGTPLPVPSFFHGDVRRPSRTEMLCTPNSFDIILCDAPYNIGAPVLVDGKDIRPRNHHFKNNDFGSKFDASKQDSAVDLIPYILAIASRVLVDGGRIILFLPVRGEDASKLLEKVDRCNSCLHLLKCSSRLQYFAPTFSRWLVCMEKRLT
ncbi:hypothetical protein ACHAWF_017059 [Thalassiosira exigua]